MSKFINRSSALLLVTAVAGCVISMSVNAESGAAERPPAQTSTAGVVAQANQNPLLAQWAGPHGGTPPFDRVRVADFKPALEAGMAEQLAEIDKIAADPAAPTFENTIAAMERAGQTLDRVTTVYGVWGSTMNTPEFQAVQREMAPKLAAFGDKITQNEALFHRIEAIYNSPAKAQLTPEQQRLVVALLHQLRPRGRQARREGQGTALGDQPEARRALHKLQPEPALGRERCLSRPQGRG